jgi:hypothetical protein
MADVSEAARAWLERISGMYKGMDAGPTDHVHAVREHARQMIEAGPTEDDPFTIAREIAEALPGDRHASALGNNWRDELGRIKAG